MSLIEKIDKQRLPQHVAIIMDGNGRWAKSHGEARAVGHQEGVVSLRKVVEAATKLGLRYLTAYTFSTENWNRPADEVSALMGLVLTALEEEVFQKNDIRFNVIGDRNRLPEDVNRKLRDVEQHTAGNKTMTLTAALSYSSRWEITDAVRRIAEEARDGMLNPENIDDSVIDRHLQTNGTPDPDLLIRTGGEQRISNYLLWQIAYTELYFTDTFWPDFRESHLHEAIEWYQQRQRRYGKTGDQVEQDA